MTPSEKSDTSQKSLSSDDDNSGNPPSLTTDNTKTTSVKRFHKDAKSSGSSSDDAKLLSELGASESGGSENGSIEDAKLLSDLGASKGGSGGSYNCTSEDAKLPSDLGASESGGSENGNPLSFGFDFDDACCFSKGSPEGSDGSGSRNSSKFDASSRNVGTSPTGNQKNSNHANANRNSGQASNSNLRNCRNDSITVVTSSSSNSSSSIPNNSTSASSSTENFPNSSAVSDEIKSSESTNKTGISKPSNNNKGVKRKSPPSTQKSLERTMDEDEDFDEDNYGEDEIIGPKFPKKGKGKAEFEFSKREERNMREKERSYQISKQICGLRELLSAGGVIVPKGTKSSVLTEAASYIRMLQQHQYRSEIERQQLIQQIQMIGKGALGPQAAAAIRHTAAKNGIWPLGSFGGVPPMSAMTSSPRPSGSSTKDSYDYTEVFNTTAVAMALASMGGTFVAANKLFLIKSGYTKQELCSLTIFNLTQREDLQTAFEQISNMISPPNEGQPGAISNPCILRGIIKDQDNIELSVALIRGNDGIAKCFCVTLIEHRTCPNQTGNFGGFSSSALSAPLSEHGQDPLSSKSPAYTTG
eukprot:CAMPEP_0113311520 /NCGR_PEP_ID=MMETSP0010_2-20120614/8727_1 /TAXON_ID=216773 ORGANISM="Corethron hystrix, Strain 308" /NCGR_SAMPLE_ID=MMETSP0010_2 /ASSEMBLY_ACC=CAM_ASM_000155 /LENGTH=585 /DNA_ID=CAMNT_0000167181 /DNA_START=296 /DNA_END=2053 /DNA_ORIENTATION=- /assembly_acc=CAM_ASM_000155